jgi:hypothetical protein
VLAPAVLFIDRVPVEPVVAPLAAKLDGNPFSPIRPGATLLPASNATVAKGDEPMSALWHRSRFPRLKQRQR